MTNSNNKLLRGLIPILALADGVLHLSLDWILFRGRLFGNPFSAVRPVAGAVGRAARPAGGGGNPFAILPLNELFLLNFIGAVVLVVLFWFAPRWLGPRRRWLLDVVMIGYEAATFIGWILFGRPNPMGLGYLSKGIEIVLIIALVADIWSILRPVGLPHPAPAES